MKISGKEICGVILLSVLIGCTTHILAIEVQITEPLPDFISRITTLTPEQSNTSHPSLCIYIEEEPLLEIVDNRGNVTDNFSKNTRLTINNVVLPPDSNSNLLALAHGIFDEDGRLIGYYSDIIVMCFELNYVEAGFYEVALTTPTAQGNMFEYSWGILIP